MSLVKAEYWHKDHQGSLVATTDHAGAVTARYAYDPYGMRRVASGNYDANGTLVYDWNRTSRGTDRGYTGHEHLDDIGVVHMNGRTFDPKLGVFMQPDPLVQDPMNTQNYNRYGYCFGDPMTCSDPTGYSFRRNHLRMHRLIMGPDTYFHLRQIAETKVGYQIGSIVIAAVSTYCTGAAAFCNAGGQADWAMLSGRSWQESVRIGAVAGLTTAAMGQVGDTWATGKNATDFSRFMNTLGHAAVGCGSSVAGGGKCSDGAISGGFSAAWGTYGPGYLPGNTADIIATNTMIAAGVGGVSSVLAGGNFATGARSGAYGYLFNCLAHQCYGEDYSKSRDYFHEYQHDAAMCLATDPDCMPFVQSTLACNSAPGQPACIVPGEKSKKRILWGGNVVTQYMPNPNMIINGSDPDHWLADGYVVRWIGVANGIVSIYTYGVGNNKGGVAWAGNYAAGYNFHIFDSIRASKYNHDKTNWNWTKK